MFASQLAQELYFIEPDRIYQSEDGTWYAMYEDEFSILSNASETIEAYTYDSKPDFREARRQVLAAYPVREIDVVVYDD